MDEESGRVSIFKTPSTPSDQAEGILTGIDGLCSDYVGVRRISHGTTVATNTLLEGNGAKVALITTGGFRDTLEIGRCRRMTADSIFNTHFVRPKPLVPRWLRFEVSERVCASGMVARPLLEHELLHIADLLRVEAVAAIAVCFLHSYLNSAHEEQAKALLERALPGAFVCTSSEILPEIREYERFSTTVVNAFVAPVMRRYIGSLTKALKARSYKADLYTMASHGGVMGSETTASYPIRTVLSGPAGGVNGAIFLAELAGIRNLITYDMGGTSTDVCLVEDLQPLLSAESIVRGMPVNSSQLDIHTVGAGGGSIAWIDIDGALKVGPRSAGAVPGPACYGRGGDSVTITDANVILGRLGSSLLEGQLPLDKQRSVDALSRLATELGKEDTVWLADGVVRLGVTTMAGAVRKISVERGHDPREFVLVAMGGAGPMHAVLVAEELGIREILVPQWPGNISALGLLAADLRHDFVRSYMKSAADVDTSDMDRICRELVARGVNALAQDGVAEERMVAKLFADMRFVGQAYELMVALPEPLAIEPLIEAFREKYKRRYGHEQEEAVEIVNLRAVCVGRTDRPVLPRNSATKSTTQEPPSKCQAYFAGSWHTTEVLRRDMLAPSDKFQGPLIINEFGTTTIVPPGWAIHCHDSGAILIRQIEQ
jgi:N-methylhydantoinase A